MSTKRVKYMVWSRLTEVRERHYVLDLVNGLIHSIRSDLMEARKIASDLNNLVIVLESPVVAKPYDTSGVSHNTDSALIKNISKFI